MSVRVRSRDRSGVPGVGSMMGIGDGEGSGGDGLMASAVLVVSARDTKPAMIERVKSLDMAMKY